MGLCGNLDTIVSNDQSKEKLRLSWLWSKYTYMQTHSSLESMFILNINKNENKNSAN